MQEKQNSIKYCHSTLSTYKLYLEIGTNQIAYESVYVGNRDICYFNYLCAIPYNQYLKDFSHLFSNIGYIILGFFFLIIVQFKHHFYKKKMELKTEGIRNGLPQHFGIFYALGFSLISIGVLSFCYHVCPTNENFQFDTTFMYVVTILIGIKIYQFRHPEVTANAYKIFFGFSIVLLLEAIGVYKKDYGWYWGILSLVYIYFMIKMGPILYQSGKWRWELESFSFQSINLFNSDVKIHKKRLAFVILFEIMNFGIMIIGVAMRNSINEISNYFLGIFAMNLMLYFNFYWIMKLIKKEPVKVMPVVMAILMMICLIPGGYLFSSKEKTTVTTPALSRNLNKPCVLMIFSGHDLWHFLSAAGLFFLFLLLLIIDDGIEDWPRNKIRIF